MAESDSPKKITIHTDGACDGNPGPGGWAAISLTNRAGKRTSLRTHSEDEAQQIVEAKNQAERQPVLNLQIARAYLAGTDNRTVTIIPEIGARSRQEHLESSLTGSR